MCELEVQIANSGNHVMGFWKKLFGAKESPKAGMAKMEPTQPTATSNPQPPSTLICTGCGKIYRIGDDAVAVALEYAFGLVRHTVVNSDAAAAEREDLIDALDVSPENLAGAREKARQNWKIIQDSLSRGQRRTWRCRACDRINVYPRFTQVAPQTADYEVFKPSLSGLAQLMRISDEVASNLTHSEAMDIVKGQKETTKGAASTLSFGDAVHKRNLEQVKAFLQEKPDLVFIKDSNGDTQLHLVAQWGYADMARLLLANNAEVDARNVKGVTPLHFAAFDGHTDLVKLLLANGANVNAKNNGDMTPLYYVGLGCGDESLCELLRQHGAAD